MKFYSDAILTVWNVSESHWFCVVVACKAHREHCVQQAWHRLYGIPV